MYKRTDILEIGSKEMILIGLAIIGLSLILRFFNLTDNNSLVAHLVKYGIYEGIFVALFSLFFVPELSLYVYQEKLECQKCRKKKKGSSLLEIIYPRYKKIVLKYRDLSLKDGWRHRVPYWIADKDGWRYSYAGELADHYSQDSADTTELCPECNLKQTKIEQDKVNEWLATPEMTEFVKKVRDYRVYKWLIINEGKVVEVTTKTIDRFHSNIQENGATITQIPPPSIVPGLLGLEWPNLGFELLPSSRFNVKVITNEKLIYTKHWNWLYEGDYDETINRSLEPTSGKGDYEEIYTIRLCSMSNNG